MERGLLMGDNDERSDPITASKSVGSFVKIDSISIDLADAGKSSSHAEKCEHFTIRGFVSEVRKKDWKQCWPFASDGDLNMFDQLEKTSALPPLNTPNFRFWSCKNCTQETGSKTIAEVHGTDINNRHIGSSSNNTYAQMPRLSDALVLLSDCQKGPKSKFVEAKTVEARTLTIGSGNEQHPSSCATYKKEGKDEVPPPTIIASENALEVYVSHQIPELSSAETEVNPETTQERHKDDTDTIAELDIANNKLWNKYSTQTSEAEYQAPAEDNQQESMNASGICKKAGMIEKPEKSTKAQTNVSHLIILDECDASPETLDKPSGSNRKKSRKKLRLLSELWNKGDAKTDFIRIDDSPSRTISNATGAGIVSQGQVSVQENSRAGVGENKKRKLPEEEEKRSVEMSHPKSLNKKGKASKQDEEATKAIADSAVEDVSRLSLQADTKSIWNRNQIERIPTIGKKKTKKANDSGACSSLVLPEDNERIESLDKVGNSSKGIASKGSFSITFNAPTGRGIDQIPFPAPKAEGKSGFCKRKGKMPQVDNGQASLFPWIRKCPKEMKDVEVMQIGGLFHLERDASADKGLDLSLNSFLAAQRCDKKSIPQFPNGFPSLPTWKDGTCKLDEFMRKNVEANYAANLNRPSNAVSNAYSGKGLHDELSSRFFPYSMPILNEKKDYSSHVEQGSCSLQQMDISRAKNKEKIVEVQKSSAVPVNRKNSNRKGKADKMSQQEVVDDIPMEIVELMARNQYERCLPDVEPNEIVLDTANKARNNQVMDHTYGIDLRMSEETSQKRKPPAKNSKNGTMTRKNVGAAKQKAVDYSAYTNGKDFGLSRLDQMHCPTGFSAFSQAQKKSTRDQFPAAGYSSCSCAQNCKWNGDMMGPGFSHSSLRTLAASNACQSIPQPKDEAARRWSSGMPVHMPLTYSNPPKFPPQPPNVTMLSHSRGSLHKGNVNGDYDLNFLNLSAATNREKHQEEVRSGTFGRTNADYSFSCKPHVSEPHQNSMGSFDIYSNETIPAMHLLSLMDAGMRSGAPFDMGGNPKFLKRPFPNDLYSKEYSAPDIGGYKATDTVKHPSPNCCGRNHISERSLDLFPLNPGGASTSSSFQHPKGLKRATDFMGVSLSSQKKEKIQRSNVPTQNRGPGSQKVACTGGGLGKNHGTTPILLKGVTVADSMMYPEQCHSIEYPMLHKLDTHYGNGAMNAPKSTSTPIVCSINRNPAEFSLPEAGNEYMMGDEDLEVGKQIPSQRRHGSSKLDQNKRKKNRKQTTGKERAQP